MPNYLVTSELVAVFMLVMKVKVKLGNYSKLSLYVVVISSCLSRVVDIHPTLYQSQLKNYVLMSLVTVSTTDVRETVDRVSAVVDNSSLGE